MHMSRWRQESRTLIVHRQGVKARPLWPPIIDSAFPRTVSNSRRSEMIRFESHNPVGMLDPSNPIEAPNSTGSFLRLTRRRYCGLAGLTDRGKAVPHLRQIRSAESPFGIERIIQVRPRFQVVEGVLVSGAQSGRPPLTRFFHPQWRVWGARRE